MVLLRIEGRGNEVVLITGEGEFPLSLSDYEACADSLSPGAEIGGEILTLAFRRALTKKALHKLSYADQTARGLYRKLTAEKTLNRYPDAEDAKQVVRALIQSGYVDDRRFCERLTGQYLEKRYGESRIRAALVKKGFGAGTIADALEQAAAQIEENLTALLSQNKDRGRDSLIRYLCRMGYSYDEILAREELWRED